MSPSDHPRIRGEHPRGPCRRPRGGGSSPHTRGAPTATNANSPTGRIIPAYAGSTCTSRRRGAPRWDHPRIRGEHVAHAGLDRADRGSSPHTRGAPDRRQVGQSCDGIIPAYAGSTGTLRLLYIQSRDHPRIRGEHAVFANQVAKTKGSSPHTRGAPTSTAPTPPWRRIIPAYAGSTRTLYPTMSSTKDHPRIRGEHVQMNRAIADGSGSSPHTRGARRSRGSARRWRRIIPAYAGSTATTPTT